MPIPCSPYAGAKGSGWQVGGDGGLVAATRAGTPSVREILDPEAFTLYAFNGAAPSRGLVQARWPRPIEFQETYVYVRTAKEVFRTRYRSLAALRRTMGLGPAEFVQIHQSVSLTLRPYLVLNGDERVVVVPVPDDSEDLLRMSRRELPCCAGCSGDVARCGCARPHSRRGRFRPPQPEASFAKVGRATARPDVP